MLQVITASYSRLLGAGHRRAHGLALVLATAAALLAVALAPTPARAQFFSPGPLSRPHSSLEGIDNCARCHDEQKGLSARLCLDCHTELQRRVATGAGFHGRLPAAKKQECQACHPDHRGVDFQMIEWEGGRDRFDHEKTGWPLRGGHAKVGARCDQCHQPRLIQDGAIQRMLQKQPRRATLLGATTRCDGCHFDEHRGQLGRECQKCHDENAWKPVPSFNHQKTDYPLLGKHRDVACAKCHPSNTDERFVATAFPKPRAPTFMQMKPVEFKSCESCHDDPHKGSLGANCAGCHSEAGWKIIKTAKDQSTAFHDHTRYPLRGGHVGVACKSCHGPFPGQAARFKGLPFGACTDCHEDGHMGQLRSQPPAKVAGCERCHTVNGFLPARYELEQHGSTSFPLENAHATTPCRGCHPIDDGLAARVPAAVHQRLKARHRPEHFSLAVLRPKKSPEICSGCHEDVHRGQFTQSGDGDSVEGGGGGRAAVARARDASSKTSCASCHTTTSFSDLRFDHDKDSRFPLVGTHARTPCAGCHPSQRTSGETAFIRYKPLDLACGGCHDDYHQGQFLVSSIAPRAGAERPPAASTGASKSMPRRRGPLRGCDACHQVTRFKETVFDHNDPAMSAYPLDGRHAKVACARCHPKVVLAPEIETVRYRPLPRLCESCHTDFHHGAFRGFEP
jgi:hypothetical protein